MGKQSHRYHHHVFATPSPVKGKGNPFSASYDTDPSASPSSRSVPDKRKQHQNLPEHSPKRGRLGHRTNLTPTKQLPFFSPTRAPPSPHHKPRASSPLRSSAISPIVIIKRPDQRRPLGQLQVTVQAVGNTQPLRITSKDFKFYEDNSPLKTPSTHIRSSNVSPTKINNKENVPPFAESKDQANADPFVRPQPRGPLSKLKRPDQVSEPSSVIASETMMVEETITTEYFAGAKIVHEVQKKTVETKVVRRSGSDDIQSILLMPVNENWGFEIHRDNVEASEMAEVVENRFEVTMEEENDDKENQDPGLGRSIDEMDWEGMVVPRTGKRKHFEDLV